MQLVRRNDWQSIQYANLRHLEDMGYVEFEPELYASSITRFNNNESKKRCGRFTEDELTIQSEIPRVVAYESGMQNVGWE